MSDITLKPCPMCQSPHVCIMLSPQQEDGSRFYYGFCYECCAEAGEGDTEEQAAEAWNALPRRLQWTKEKPTKEGWYWYRDKVTEPIMSLITTLDHQLVMNAYRRYQNAFIDRLDGEYDEEWAGPIPEPQEAK